MTRCELEKSEVGTSSCESRSPSSTRPSSFAFRHAYPPLLLLFLTACAAEPPLEPGRNVVLVTIDTLRADHLPFFGYPRPTAPFLTRLATEGFSFEQAFAHSATTRPSHLSMLTALYPIQHGVRDNHQIAPDELATVAEIFASRGYATAAFVSSAALASESNLEQGFATWDGYPVPGGPDHGPYRPADTTTDAAIRWLEAQSPDRRYLLWVHYYDPHKPHRPPPEHFAALNPSSPEEMERLSEFLVRQQHSDLSRPHLLDRIVEYDAEIRFVDTEIERLYSVAAHRPDHDETLWIVTSDHGQGLGNHHWFGHHKQIYNVQLHVPLLFHRPDGSLGPSRVSDAVVGHVDLAATLAELAGAELEQPVGPVQGRSLLPVIRRERLSSRPRPVFSERRPAPPRSPGSRVDRHELGERFALQDGRFKYIWYSEGRDELYRVDEDPYETNDLLDEAPSEGLALGRTLDPLVRDLRRHDEVETVGRSTRDELRALGYLD